jgi:DNA-binding transcriptional LysR family regulator
MDKLLAMEVFSEVASQGSFTKAAQKFSITPTMVGKHVKQLEQNMGVNLITRTTRKQTLTEIGVSYLQECRQVLQDIQKIEQKMSAIKHSPKGKIKINAPVTLGSFLLTPLITEFLNHYSELEIELILNDSVVDALHEEYDFVFRIGELADSSLIARKITSYEMCFCASPSYLATFGTPTSLQALSDHTCLGLTHWQIPGSVTTQLPTKGFDHLKTRFRSNSGQALKVSALNHGGILLQPRWLIHEELAQGKLIEVLSEHVPEDRAVNMLYKSRTNQPYKNKLFIDFILGQLSPCK